MGNANQRYNQVLTFRTVNQSYKMPFEYTTRWYAISFSFVDINSFDMCQISHGSFNIFTDCKLILTVCNKSKFHLTYDLDDMDLIKSRLISIIKEIID